jgi:uncharacterized protein YwqG
MQLSETNAGRLPDVARRYLGPSAGTLLSATSQSVRLRRLEACDATGNGSRLGGAALLPAGLAWPATDAGKPLSFIGQVNTNEVGVPDQLPPLPPNTLIAFFYEADEQQGWGFDPQDHQYWRVITVPLTGAMPMSSPDGALTFSPHRLVPGRVTTVPSMWEPVIEELWAADQEALRRLYTELEGGDEAPRHRMFGWPDLVQNPMQLECQLASGGIYVGGPEGYRDPRAAPLSGGAAEWTLLLQVDTDDDVGWMWGDVGTIFYWIRASDLHAGRFDRVWMVFQCY